MSGSAQVKISARVLAETLFPGVDVYVARVIQTPADVLSQTFTFLLHGSTLPDTQEGVEPMLMKMAVEEKINPTRTTKFTI